MSPAQACGCGKNAMACRRCPPTSATTGAQLRLSAPVLVALDDQRRRAAVGALAALLAPYVAPVADADGTAARHAGRRRLRYSNGNGAHQEDPNQHRRHGRPDDEEERRWPEGP